MSAADEGPSGETTTLPPLLTGRWSGKWLFSAPGVGQSRLVLKRAKNDILII
ncbi:hypothetical protein [Pseudomonas sp. EA_5y_Pfl2_R50]|uniref:hypothetical protein n=1 Tax=Pseudomonas sp. EA_5y_Pfl2_R50 TaxID=3088691 RepID=UPI0030DD97C3